MRFAAILPHICRYRTKFTKSVSTLLNVIRITETRHAYRILSSYLPCRRFTRHASLSLSGYNVSRSSLRVSFNRRRYDGDKNTIVFPCSPRCRVNLRFNVPRVIRSLQKLENVAVEIFPKSIQDNLLGLPIRPSFNPGGPDLVYVLRGILLFLGVRVVRP